MKTLLEDRINFENAYEDIDVDHPLSGLSFEQIERHMMEVYHKYPGYDDYVYEKNFKCHGYGAMTGWYELWGIKV